jgi:hypothetical protein
MSVSIGPITSPLRVDATTWNDRKRSNITGRQTPVVKLDGPMGRNSHTIMLLLLLLLLVPLLP